MIGISLVEIQEFILSEKGSLNRVKTHFLFYYLFREKVYLS